MGNDNNKIWYLTLPAHHQDDNHAFLGKNKDDEIDNVTVNIGWNRSTGYCRAVLGW